MIGFTHTPLDWAVLLCAPVVGSFAGVVVDRTARGENFTTGRSRCEACGRDLQPYDLVPVFSWLALRGRCRYCHAAIRPSHLLIELAALSIAIIAFLFSTGPALWAGCLLGWTLLAMALIDLKTLRLPDFGNYLLIAGGMAVTYILAPDAAIDHAIGAVSGFLILFAVSWLYRQIRGRVGHVTEEGADAHIDSLSKKYLGMDKYPYAQPDQIRVIFEIEPGKVQVMG